MVECYRQRKYVEDIEFLKGELKGSATLLEALEVDPEQGIHSNSLEARTEVFGSHHKDPPKLTPFFVLVLGALDDFMLKLLIVCAIIAIPIDVGFAEPDERSFAWVEGFAILVAVALVSLVSASSDYSKEK